MHRCAKIKKILNCYESENPGTRASLARMLMHGKMAGTGKLVILPVDQGFEHGPVKSFATNTPSYDPLYHFRLADECGLSAYAAPLGMLEAGAASYAGVVPLILKMNSSISLMPKNSCPDQVMTASVSDALRLGCCAVGMTIYPGSHQFFSMVSEIRDAISEAKACGLAVVLWSYPRGEGLSNQGETAVDVVAYAAHVAALLGANIIKVKLPTEHIERDKIPSEEIDTLAKRVSYIKRACFNGKRIVVFSGGQAKSMDELYSEVRAIRDGGGDGSIIGRNAFQRPQEEARSMLMEVMSIYSGGITNLE